MEHPVTTVGSALRRRLDRIRSDQEAGFSLMETLVGMTIMTIFMAIFSSAVISMFNATNKTTAINDTSSQLNIAFARLDKQVRYASAISTEGQSGGSWFVEFLTTNTGTSVCSQLKLDPTTQILQERTWTVPATGTATASGWAQLADHVSNGGQAANSADRPFQYIAPHSATKFQQLTVRLFSTEASNATTTQSLTSVTFTALNTTRATLTTGVCTQVVRS